MRFSLLAHILWAAGFIELSILLIVLLLRGRWRIFPMFTGWIGYQIIRSILLFFLYRIHADKTYAITYWSAYCADVIIETAIIFELAKIVLKPAGAWVRQARKTFYFLVISGFILALIAAFSVDPVFPSTLDKWLERGCLFDVMLVAQLFAAMVLTSKRLGLVWRHHVMVIATGWTFWAIIGIFVESAYSHFGSVWHGIELDQIQIVAYQIATIYWTINLWLPEPESRTLSPEMLSYLARLQEQARLGAQTIRSIDKN